MMEAFLKFLFIQEDGEILRGHDLTNNQIAIGPRFGKHIHPGVGIGFVPRDGDEHGRVNSDDHLPLRRGSSTGPRNSSSHSSAVLEASSVLAAPTTDLMRSRSTALLALR